MNYVYHKGNVYFHGSKIGQKIKDITACPQVTFTVAKEYAVVPSYYSDPKLACPATTYFKSVCIWGHATILEDLYEKAEALTAFMEKLQPEGGYDPIDPADAGYLSNLKAIAEPARSLPKFLKGASVTVLIPISALLICTFTGCHKTYESRGFPHGTYTG